MKILAVEFSSEHRGVAVLAGASRSEYAVLGKAVETGGRRAIALVEQALEQAQCEREEIECLAVGLGPGSYTGIRGAIALAQGWQLGRGVKLLGVSSVECMAAQAQEERIFGFVNIVVDAQRNEFYLARYQIDAGACIELAPLHITSFDAAQKHLAEGEAVIGPEVSQWFAGGRDIYPNPVMLGRLALDRRGFINGADMQPIYLRETTFKKAPPTRTIL